MAVGLIIAVVVVALIVVAVVVGSGARKPPDGAEAEMRATAPGADVSRQFNRPRNEHHLL